MKALLFSVLGLVSCIQQPYCPEIKEPTTMASQGMKRSAKQKITKKPTDLQVNTELAKIQKLKATFERLKLGTSEFRPNEDLPLLETLKLEKVLSTTQAALLTLLLAHRAYNDTSFSLAQDLSAFGLDLSPSLISNPELNTLQVTRLFLEISKSLDAESQALVHGALSQVFASWDELKSSSSLQATAAPAPLKETATPPAVAPSAAVVPEVEMPPKVLPPDPIRESQLFVDKSQYAEAIKQLAAIKKEEAHFAKAQQRIKEISNLGVQDLRKKAAKAFQSAVPLNDPKTKSTYLRTAKTYLEEALDQFPNADQLQTVRDNLEVITKNLDQLAKK